MLLSIVAVPAYVPTNSVGSFPLLHILSSVNCRFFDDGHSGQCEVLLHCNFYSQFSSN